MDSEDSPSGSGQVTRAFCQALSVIELEQTKHPISLNLFPGDYFSALFVICPLNINLLQIKFCAVYFHSLGFVEYAYFILRLLIRVVVHCLFFVCI